MYALILLLAFLSGLLFRYLGFPPLLGYLITGFAANAMGVSSAEDIEPFADLGITLLLFTIGLKLEIRKLVAPHVLGVAVIHMVLAVVLFAPTILILVSWIPSLGFEDSNVAWTLAFALSFSSTVFAVKIFDTRGESASLHASIAIGILIIQDLVAVVYLVGSSGKIPSIWSLALLALPLARPFLISVLKRAGHGELLLLFGIGVALGAYELFELVGLKGGLGALVFGVLMGNTAKSNELYKALVQLKDLFLIGFFLLIGFFGLPSLDMMLMAGLLCLLLFLRPVIYVVLFMGFRLRARTAFLSGFSLFNYSEFGLIVAAIALESGLLPPEWLTTLALAMALSFFISTPLNTRIHSIYAHWFNWAVRHERRKKLPVEQFPHFGEANIAVMGMGRVGLGAYEYLEEENPGQVIGIEENEAKAKRLSEEGYRCFHGDATDQAFWLHTHLNECERIFVCLTNHQENLYVINLARENGFSGDIAVVSRFPDQARELEELGCVTFNLYAEAGRGFAEDASERLDQRLEERSATGLTSPD